MGHTDPVSGDGDSYKGLSKLEMIKQPDFFTPVPVKSKQWGKKVDINKYRGASTGQRIEAFSKYANSKPPAVNRIGVAGEGFLDDPEFYKDTGRMINMLLSGAEKKSEEQAKEEIDQKDRIVDGLKVPLLDHQVRGLKFFLRREEMAKKHDDQYQKGGLLCDDMGLGKTVQMMSLILSNSTKHCGMKPHGKNLKTTLVVCPAPLVIQWVNEIKLKTNLTVYAYTGSKRTRDKDELGRYDVVVTSYNTCMADFQSQRPPLFDVTWWRVILDEAHTIRNPDTKTARACYSLDTQRRWCLTGTPIQNKLEDLGSLFQFLQVNELEQPEIYKTLISRAHDGGFLSLQSALEECMIRRKKDVLKDNFKLPPKKTHRIFITQTPFEKHIYKKLHAKITDQMQNESTVKDGQVGVVKAKKGLGNMKSDGTDYMAVFTYLLRLRQTADHWKILFKFNPTEDMKESVCGQASKGKKMDVVKPKDEFDLLADLMTEMSLDKLKPEEVPDRVDESMDVQETSAKVKKVLEILEIDPKRKTVIFSEFVSMHQILAEELLSKGIKFLRYDGSMSQTEKADTLKLMEESSEYTVLLMSLKCGALGLNLTFCSQVILYEPFWNPSVSDQAIDRVYRIGQKETVDAYEFITRHTVETRILELQGHKRKLSQAVVDKDKPAMLSLLQGSKLSYREMTNLIN